MRDRDKTEEQLIKELAEARRRTEEVSRDSLTQLAELEHLYQVAPVGLCLIDTDMRYVRINQTLADINGKSIYQHVGKTVQEVIPDIAAQVESVHREVIEAGRPALGYEVVGETAAEPGKTRHWLGNHYPLKLGCAVVGVSVVVEEITERIVRCARPKRNRAVTPSDCVSSPAVSSICRSRSAVTSRVNSTTSSVRLSPESNWR